MTKVHLLAGPNNVGKSNVLRVARHLLTSLSAGPPDLQAVDMPLGTQNGEPLRIAVLREVSAEDWLRVIGENNAQHAGPLGGLFTGETFRSATDGIWFEFELAEQGAGRSGWVPSQRQIEDLHKVGEARGPVVAELSSIMTGTRGGGKGEDALRVLDRALERLQVKKNVPPVRTIGAFRQIGPGTTEGVIDDEHNGPGLIERLAAIQNPAFDRADDKKRFDEINAFVRTLFDDPHAAVEVPYDRTTLYVHHEGRRLPLENYGTGLHEVIILAAAATVLSEHLVCIEEPEIHLHPALQRRLLRYLCEHTDNQYLVATHSAHMLDAARASITAVRLDRGNSCLTPVLEPKEVADITAGLGARASDLVQANAVIWVEGPSDRTYICGWMKSLAPELMEGIHFSVLFYGGSLLRHLSADDRLVSEFIALPRINRNFSIVIDSDRQKKGSKLNATKARVRREIDEFIGKGSAWVTKGYTIENYIPPELLADSVRAVHPKASCSWTGDLYVNPLGPTQVMPVPQVPDKLRIATEVMTRWYTVEAWPHDLKGKVSRLVAMVRAANDLEAPVNRESQSAE